MWFVNLSGLLMPRCENAPPLPSALLAERIMGYGPFQEAKFLVKVRTVNHLLARRFLDVS